MSEEQSSNSSMSEMSLQKYELMNFDDLSPRLRRLPGFNRTFEREVYSYDNPQSCINAMEQGLIVEKYNYSDNKYIA